MKQFNKDIVKFSNDKLCFEFDYTKIDDNMVNDIKKTIENLTEREINLMKNVVENDVQKDDIINFKGRHLLLASLLTKELSFVEIDKKVDEVEK